MQDVDPESLPSVAEAREAWRESALEFVRQPESKAAQRAPQAILEGLFRTRSYVTEGEV